MARMRSGDVALVAAGIVLAAASARQISVSNAEHGFAAQDRVVYASRFHRRPGRFGPTNLTVLHDDPPNRLDRACAAFRPARPAGAPRRLLCANIEHRAGVASIVRTYWAPLVLDTGVQAG
jgi:hypothetical protein